MAGPQDVQQVKVTVVRGSARNLSIPSCSVSADDLRRLYQILEKKAGEAADYQVAALQQQLGQTVEQFEQFKGNVRSSLDLVVRVQGSSGEWTSATTIEALRDDSIPTSIAMVEYHSAFLFRGQFNIEPQNSFSLTLDFTKTSILDLTNLAVDPDVNKSAAFITGQNATWVNGVYEELRTFFNDRTTAHGLLHSRYAYDLLVLSIGFPVSFAFVYRADRVLKPVLNLPDALFVALYVYLVLVALIGFRLVFNYAKWIFPKIEGPTRRQRGPKRHKAFLATIGVALLSLVISSLLRMLGIQLF